MIIRLIISGLVIGSAYSLLGIGYSTIYRASGLLNFAHPDMLMLGGFFGMTFYKIMGLPFGAAIFLSVLCVSIIGALIQKNVIGNLQKKGSGLIYLVLSTVAVSMILQNVCQIIWGSMVIQVPPLFHIDSIQLFGANFQPEALVAIGASLICMVAVHVFFKYSRFGVAMRAASMDDMAARSCGINTALTTCCTFGVAAGIGALGGTLLGPLYGVSITFASSLGTKAFAGAVIGGYGNMYGAVVGGLLVGLLETFAAAIIPSQYKDFITYGLLLLILFIRPTGLLNDQKVFETR